MQITITDETFSGSKTNELTLDFEKETITVKELIEQRVTQEVYAYNQKLVDKFNGLVQPLDKEKTLNHSTSKKINLIDAEQQVYIALDAFQKNGFFILVDQQQVDDLNFELQLKPQLHISFIKLVPLVGG